MLQCSICEICEDRRECAQYFQNFLNFHTKILLFCRCDLLEATDADKRFTGAVIGALTQAMAVMSGAEIVYKDEAATVKEVNDEITKAAASAKNIGRSMGPPSPNVTAAATEKLVNMGRETVAGKKKIHNLQCAMTLAVSNFSGNKK